jgi:c(7)-type cytochrome triheme protein
MKLASLLVLVTILALGPVASHHAALADTLGDIVYTRPGGGGDPYAPAYFPHWVHRVQYTCYACHDALFPMQRGPNPTMAAMSRGQSCGACHNSKVAFGTDVCQRCHVQQ